MFSFVFFRLLGLLFFPSFLGGKNMSVLEGFGVEEKGVFLWHGSCCMWAAAGGRLKYMKKRLKAVGYESWSREEMGEQWRSVKGMTERRKVGQEEMAVAENEKWQRKERSNVWLVYEGKESRALVQIGGVEMAEGEGKKMKTVSVRGKK